MDLIHVETKENSSNVSLSVDGGLRWVGKRVARVAGKRDSLSIPVREPFLYQSCGDGGEGAAWNGVGH